VLLYILMGIIQFGLIFSVYITVNNAVREGARWASFSLYDNTLSGDVPVGNDTARNNGLVDRMIQSRGILSMAARGSSTSNFSTTSTGTYAVANCPTQSPSPELGYYYGTSNSNPDVTICYSRPTGIAYNDTRKGYYLEVQVYYHLQVFIPLIQPFLPDDPVKGAPWIRLPGRMTIVVN